MALARDMRWRAIDLLIFFFFFFFGRCHSKLGRSKFYILIELYFLVENAKIPGLSMSQIKELWVGR